MSLLPPLVDVVYPDEEQSKVITSKDDDMITAAKSINANVVHEEEYTPRNLMMIFYMGKMPKKHLMTT